MAVYDARLREFMTKNDKKVSEAEIKSKKSQNEPKSAFFEAKYVNYDENDEKLLKNDEKVPSKRNLDKMATFSKNYGNPCGEVKMGRVEAKPPELQVGDRVILTYKYIPGPSYPVWGTKYECIGSITLLKEGGRVRVDWDNGRAHEYPRSVVERAPGQIRDTGVRDSKGKRLILHPNQAFRLHKRGSMDRLKVEKWNEKSFFDLMIDR